MSRAFVSEGDSEFDDEQVPEIKNPLPPGAKNYVTPAGAELLTKELHDLSSEERPELQSALSRLSGAVSNTERDERANLRRRLREVDERIKYLRTMSAIVEIVDPRRQHPARVAFGAKVTVIEAGEEKSYHIVGIDEADPTVGKVSWISPIAKAMIAARVGDSVVLNLPDRSVTLKIMTIEYA